MASWKQNKIRFGFLETATSGGTLTLIASSLQYQILTGSSNHTVVLPNATTLAEGIAFSIVNSSTGTITVKLADTSTTLITLSSGQGAALYLSDISTSNGVWNYKTGSTSVASGFGTIAPGATKTSNYTIVSGDNGGVINVDTAAGALNITLPSPAAAFKVTVKDIGGMAATNKINIVRNGSELVDGVPADSTIDENNMAISFISDGTDWTRFDSLHRSLIPTSGRGVFGGGTTGSNSAIMDFITISTTGIATTFGNLTTARTRITSCASMTRGLFAGGDTGSDSSVIDYITISSAGNATSFGTLTSARSFLGSCSNSTRGIFAGGLISTTVQNTIDYVTIPTTGIATTFGNLSVARGRLSEGCASPILGVFGGGGTGSNGGTVTNIIDFINIATTGNATSFGILFVSRNEVTGCSNSIRGLFGGGNTGSNSAVIDYITIASASNATNFGNLTSARNAVGACSSAIRGVFAGGGTPVTTIDYVTIATAGNATSFGTLTVARVELAGCSSSHGGLNG